MSEMSSNDRRKLARRADDKDALMIARRALEKADKMGEQLDKAIVELRAHVVGCDMATQENLRLSRESSDRGKTNAVRLETLETIVQPIASYHEARLRKEQKRAETSARISEFIIGVLRKGFEDVFGKILWLVILALLAGKVTGLFEFLHVAAK